MHHAPLRPLAATAALALTLGLTLAGCGSGSDDGTDTTAGANTEASNEASTGATSASSAGTSTTKATTATTETGAGASTSGAVDDSEATVIEATVAGGKVTVDKDRFEVAKGSDVIIRVTDDVAEPIHLHGYDIEVDAAPGKPAEIAFTADVPGVFEVELEDSGTLLFEIEVK